MIGYLICNRTAKGSFILTAVYARLIEHESFSIMKYIILFFVLIVFSVAGYAGDHDIMSAYQSKTSDVQVNGRGTVIKTLADDNKGSRHQRLILEFSSGHTVLIAHNIDLAPRINSIAIGDSLDFYGEYEWNNKGGVIHWTHHDPAGKHQGGWLKHKGILYE